MYSSISTPFFVVVLLGYLPSIILADNPSMCASDTPPPPNDVAPPTPPGDCPDLGDPLLLSPYIARGDVFTARKLCTITVLPDDPLGTRSYSGFITVNASDNSNLFFWMFEPTNITLQQLPPDQVPLFIYLEGGPGTSSLFALLVANGPFFVYENLTLYANNNSLTNLGRVIYIDNPVGVGFSFTNTNDGYSHDQSQVGENLYNFLTQFYQLFPELRASPLHITGESYGAKYVAALGMYIYAQNQQYASTSPQNLIPLSSIIIGDGWSDPENMYESYGSMIYNWGMATLAELDYINNATSYIRALILQSQWRAAFDEADKLIYGLAGGPYASGSFITNITGNAAFLQNPVNNNAGTSASYFYLQRCDVRAALHVGNLTFQPASTKAAYYLCQDMLQTVRPWLETLMNNYRTLLYNGQLDIIAGAPLTDRMLLAMDDWTARDDWLMSAKFIWRDPPSANVTGGDVAGYVKRTRSGQFYHAVVRGAGHSAQKDEPARCADLFQRFLQNDF